MRLPPRSAKLLADHLRDFAEDCRPWSRFDYAVAILALTYRCQCSCPHCGVFPCRGAGRKEWTGAQVYRLMDSFAELGVEVVNFFGGEPLMDRRLVDYARYASGKGLSAVADTNGLLLDGPMAARLKDAGLKQLYVSIDSPDPGAHDRLRGVQGLFEKAVAGIRHCVRLNLDCVVSTYATKENLRNGDLERVIGLGKSLGVKIRLTTPIHAGRLEARADALLAPAELRRYRSLLEDDGTVYWDVYPVEGEKGVFTCYAAKNMFYVSPFGDVQPCCYCAVSFGNVRREPLADILRRLSGSRMADSFRGRECPVNDPVFRENNKDLLEAGVYCADAESAADARQWDERALPYGPSADPVFGMNDPFVTSRCSFVGKSVLDAGCGTGRFAVGVAAQAAAVLLCDISPKMLEQARGRLAGRSNAAFLQADVAGRALGLDRRFDVVVASGVLRHVRDFGRAVANLKAALKDGGRLLALDVVGGDDGGGAASFHSEFIGRHGFAAWRGVFLREPGASLMKGLLGGRLMSLGELEEACRPLLPGARVGRVNGLFAFVEWVKR